MQETATLSTAPAAVGPINAARLANHEKRSPALLNERQAAELLGVSTRKFHALRNEEWLPAAVALGERSLRWSREELLRAVYEQAPRLTLKAEPAHLAQSRANRARVPA